MLALIVGLGLLLQPIAVAVGLPLVPRAQVEQVPEGARVLATTSVGPSAEGATETLVAYFQRDASLPGSSFGRVGALVVRADASGSRTYPLGEDLGEAPSAELIARDINGDGLTELGVLGSVGVHSWTLGLWRWDGSGYALLDEFFGDSGLTVRDLDGDRVEEVIVGQRHYDRAQLRHDTVFSWNGLAYAPAYNRWGFTFDDPGFKEYPEAVVVEYYLRLAARDYQAAWNLVGPSMRSGQTFAEFSQGFAGTRDVRVEDLEVTSEDAATATVRVEISSVEQDGTAQHFEGTWIAERSGESWRLAGSYITPV
jgi:hypothetical protein